MDKYFDSISSVVLADALLNSNLKDCSRCTQDGLKCIERGCIVDKVAERLKELSKDVCCIAEENNQLKQQLYSLGVFPSPPITNIPDIPICPFCKQKVNLIKTLCMDNGTVLYHIHHNCEKLKTVIKGGNFENINDAIKAWNSFEINNEEGRECQN